MPHQSPNSDPLSPFFFFTLILLIIPYLWLYSPQSFHSPFTYFSLHYFSFYQYSSFNLHLSFFDSSSSHFIFYKFTILSPIWSTYFPHKNCDCSLSLSLSLIFFLSIGGFLFFLAPLLWLICFCIFDSSTLY